MCIYIYTYIQHIYIIFGYYILDPFLSGSSEPQTETICSTLPQQEDCSCGIAAILESRSHKMSSSVTSTTQSTISSVSTNVPRSLGMWYLQFVCLKIKLIILYYLHV